jgi:hypothetical protein
MYFAVSSATALRGLADIPLFHLRLLFSWRRTNKKTPQMRGFFSLPAPVLSARQTSRAQTRQSALGPYPCDGN